MKAQNVLQAQMRDAFERFQGSELSQKAFCQAEGISKGKFNYWCRQFKQTTALPPISTEKSNTNVEKKATPSQAASGFTPLSLLDIQTPTPLMVLDVAGKGRLEFYAPVEASFLVSVRPSTCMRLPAATVWCKANGYAISRLTQSLADPQH